MLVNKFCYSFHRYVYTNAVATPRSPTLDRMVSHVRMYIAVYSKDIHTTSDRDLLNHTGHMLLKAVAITNPNGYDHGLPEGKNDQQRALAYVITLQGCPFKHFLR